MQTTLLCLYSILIKDWQFEELDIFFIISSVYTITYNGFSVSPILFITQLFFKFHKNLFCFSKNFIYLFNEKLIVDLIKEYENWTNSESLHTIYCTYMYLFIDNEDTNQIDAHLESLERRRTDSSTNLSSISRA